MTIAAVDTEGAVRTWARTEANITAAVDGAVWFATPQSYADTPGKPPFSNAPAAWIVLSLVSEIEEPSDLGMQQPIIQFTCWGKTKALAAATSVAVENAAKQLQWGPPVTVGSAVIQSAAVNHRRLFPDSVTNLPRYVVDLLFTIRGAES